MNPRLTLQGHSKDLGGGFVVRRLLPSAPRQAVGPFLFFDHFGPVTAGPQDNHDVRPHPHIGLATVTYLFEGAMLHRDSTGVVQRIEPGAINWMTAGRGIVHSERTPDDLRQVQRRSHGLQLWSALPAADEETGAVLRAHAGVGHPGGRSRRRHGARAHRPGLRPALAGGRRARPRCTWTSRCAPARRCRCRWPPSARCMRWMRPSRWTAQAMPAQQMVVLQPGEQPMLGAAADARVVLIGGEPLGHRFMVWNFVSSRKERIVQAQDDWRAQRFDPVPGETEFIPLP